LLVTEASINCGINKKMSAGKDWFAGFVKRNGDTALWKPEQENRG